MLQLILSAVAVVFLATAAYAQQTEYLENQRLNMESHVGNMTGHATVGQSSYKRFCIGCHGDLGDGQGENAQWIDPKRDFPLPLHTDGYPSS
jgi:cytochrome c5